MHIAILSRQIGHYHDARYRGAELAFDKVTVVSTTSQGGFSEFLATRVGSYERAQLFADRASYDAALADGEIGAALDALLEKISPDVLAVAGWASAESAVAIAWAARRGIPLVMMSESQADDANREPLREFIKARVVRLCGAALVGGPPHAAYVKQLGIAPERVFLGYNAVDNEHFRALADAARAQGAKLRHTLGLPERYFLASARFIEKKNLPALISAHGRITASNDTAPELVILGDGEARASIEAARAAHPNPARVHLPGFRGYDDLPAYYGLSDAFVHVSTVEQWGLVVNEAMASGVPVIVSQNCGVARTVLCDEISGLVTATSSQAIEEKLRRFLALTPAARQVMAAAAREGIADWGPERFGSGLRRAAEAALALSNHRRPGAIDRLILARMARKSIDRVS